MEMEMEDNYNRTPFNEWRNLVVDHNDDQFEYKPIVEGTNPQESNKGIENQALSSSIGSFDASNDQKVNSSSSSSSSLCTSLGGVLWKKVALSLAERRAAKCSINGFKTPPPVRTHVTSSPFLTIPSGISPTALLDSPIMLPNSQGQSSPTTGSFEFPNFLHDNQMMLSTFPAEEDRKAVLNFSSQGDTRDQNTAASMVVDTLALEVFRGPLDNKLTPQKREHTDANEERRNQYFPEMEKKGIIHHHPATVAKTDDGYNWRKYGQKHVKGSEFPRSYFKCTHPNCTMKKKVERSHDGEITEIVYRGVHNHPMSQINANGRSMFGSSNPYSEMSDRRVENGMVCRNNIQSGGGRYNYSDWRGEGTSGSSVLTETSDPLSKSRGGHFRSPGSHDGEDEDRTTQGSVSFGEDGDGDESEAKRRKKDSCPIETIGPSRSTREPKVVVQIESEIDVLDDGYRWRKYGQKVVKGNPNPRSYYKCTSAGCPVRKHVERASDNLKSVITTYEGKHNHEVPSKNNNSSNSNKMDNFPPAASNNHSNMTLAQTNSKPAGMQVQDYQLPLRGNDFMRTNFLGNIANDMNIGASSIYQMGFPSLPNHMSYNPYMLNASSGDSSMALPMNLPGSPNMALGNYRYNNYAGVQSSMGGQHLREFDSRLNKPKEEQQRDVENLYDSCLSINDQDATFFQVLGNY